MRRVPVCVRRRPPPVAVGALAALLLVVAGTGGTAAAGLARTAVKKGGVYRVAFEHSFGFTDSFYPTGEHYRDSFNIFSNFMSLTHCGHHPLAGPAATRLHTGRLQPSC